MTAGAQQVRFYGQTLGCFYVGAGGNCAPTAMSSLLGALTYHAGTFDIYTDPIGVSGTSFAAVGGFLAQSHGSLTSTSSSFGAPANKYFLRLQTTVNGPLVDGNGNSTTGEAGDNIFTNDFSIFGSTSAPNVGGVHFQPINSALYSGIFSNGQVLNQPLASASGTVDLWTYDNQSLTAGQTVYLSSFVQITSSVTTPEPATVTLMATGLLAVFGAGFARRRNNA
jgi:hypothetical protein